jgi:hypothetical protein
LSTARDTGLKIWWTHPIAPQYRGHRNRVKRYLTATGSARTPTYRGRAKGRALGGEASDTRCR